MKNMTIGIIGGGNMGEAIIRGVASKFRIFISEQNPSRLKYLQKTYRLAAGSIPDLVRKSGIIILAVKPQDFESVLAQVRSCPLKSKLIISIAAGITTAYIEKKLGNGVHVIRTMPNLPAQVHSAVTALAKGRWANAADLKKAKNIFSLIGESVIINERLMNAVTAVSGSGPAYVFLFIEILEKAAARLGFDQETSRALVMKTLEGSLKLLSFKGEPAASLRMKVTSKGGTTQAALEVLNKRKVEAIFIEALRAAEHRANVLSKQ